MTLEEYKKLDELEQLLHFWKAVRVGEYTEAEFTYECRQLDSFYIELTTNGGSYVQLYPHKDTDRLERYIDRFDLDALLFQ